MSTVTNTNTPVAANLSDDDVQHIDRLRDSYGRFSKELGRVIVGQKDTIEQLAICLFARRHALLMGVPGLAKTLLVSKIAETMSLGFSRIQFTPDLMPMDITGTDILKETAEGRREFQFIKGPIFANIILADEINRAPPKTQAALLEAMQEQRVTVLGKTFELTSPFMVLATQNPVEQEGTYPLPEAQLDRFMLQILIGYPTADEEAEIVRRTTGAAPKPTERVLSGEDVRAIQALVREVPVADHVVRYALRLVRATRQAQDAASSNAVVGGQKLRIMDYVSWGAGPRASQFLVLAAKARALLAGAPTATPDDVRAVAKPILRHRLQLNFNAQADRIGPDQVIDELLREIRVEDTGAAGATELERLVKPAGA